MKGARARGKGRTGGNGLTQPEGKHVGQRPREVVHDVKLPDHEGDPPPRRALPEGGPQRIAEDEEGGGVEGAEGGAYDELSMAEASEGDQGLGDAGEEQGTDEGARDGAREGEVVEAGGEAGADGGGGGAVDEDVVGGLYVEGLLDLCVGGEQEVDEGGEEEEG